MLVAEKTRHINTHIYGKGADQLIEVLRKQIPTLEIIPENDEEELSEICESEWFAEMEREVSSGMKLRIRRENKGWTQAELSERSGIAIPNISLMEADKRGIGVRSARKLADALGCRVSDFIE